MPRRGELADLRDGGYFGRHRGATFDATGERMLYLRGSPITKLVVRDLASGRETVRDAGRGLVWRADFDAQGRWVEMTIIPSGEWPNPLTTLARRACRGAPRSYSTFGNDRDVRTTERFVSIDDGRTYEGEDLVAPFGKDVLKRAPDGALIVVGPASERTLVPAECGPRLLHADPDRQSVVVSCGGAADAGLWLFRHDGGYDLHTDVRYVDGDRRPRPARRVVRIDDKYVDMEAVRVVAEPALGIGEVRRIRDYQTNKQGVYAERGTAKCSAWTRWRRAGFTSRAGRSDGGGGSRVAPHPSRSPRLP